MNPIRPRIKIGQRMTLRALRKYQDADGGRAAVGKTAAIQGNVAHKLGNE
jgi:hypothetical protein